MKISFILPAAFGTGGIKVVYEYARRLTKKGNEVVVYIPLLAYNMRRGNLLVDLLKQWYVTAKNFNKYIINRIQQEISKDEETNIKIVPVISNNYIDDADVVIATAWCTAHDVNRLSNQKGKKIYFVQGYEIWDNEMAGKNSYRLPMKKIVIAGWIKDRLMCECNCKENEMSVINNGVDTNIFNVERNIDKSKTEIICLMLDHVLEKKGTEYGVEAYKLAKKVVSDLKLVMFGMKKSRYVPGEAEYYENPPRNVLVELYQKASIFIYPSIEEGWGLTPVEAMACKCAVVGTNVGCMLDLGMDGKNVILCDKADAAGLSKAIVKLAQDDKLRYEISESGYETVQNLDWDKAADKFEAALKEL